MVNEIVLVVDPALHKIEEILLWKNKFKTITIFSLIHLFFWLFYLSNVHTYCLISCILLILHLLDGYRAKKRREIIRSKQNLNINIKIRKKLFILFLLFNKPKKTSCISTVNVKKR